MASEFFHNLVRQAVGDRFGGVQVKVPVGVAIDGGDRLTGGFGQDLVQLGADFFHLLCLNVDVGCRPNHAAGDERLVNEHAGMRVEQSTAFRDTGKQNRAHGGGHARHHDGDRRGDQLHCVVDGHAGGDGAARGIDIKNDVFDDVGMRLESVLQMIDVFSEKIKELEERKKEMSKLLLSKYSAKKLENEKLSIQILEKQGSVNYKIIPELSGVNLDAYRGSPTTQIRVVLKGGK